MLLDTFNVGMVYFPILTKIASYSPFLPVFTSSAGGRTYKSDALFFVNPDILDASSAIWMFSFSVA